MAVSSSDAEVIAAIDQFIRRDWALAGVKPAEAAADAEWCRRVYLDVLGRIPTVAEVNAFMLDRSRLKRQSLVDQLLHSDEYSEEFARNWATIWMNLLIGRSEDQPLVRRDGLHQYLRRSFLRNKPYDQMTVELLTAAGSNRPGDEDFNGAANFLLAHLADNAAAATSRTAQLFMGVQVQCTQCHNHPFNDARQNQFWELNAFFRQAQAVSLAGDREDDAVWRLSDVDFAGEGDTPDEAEIYYEQRNGVLKAAYPVFLDGRKIPTSGRVAEVRRRDELAQFVVSSPRFAEATVNRIWAHFLGYGFTRPVDDMGPHNPPSHPELLSRLGLEFAGHGFDLRQLMRWVVLSEPYSLSSKSAVPARDTVGGDRFVGDRRAVDAPEAGQAPLFSRFYVRQMRAEELYESLLTAAHPQHRISLGQGVERAPGASDADASQRSKSQWLQQFTFALQNDENQESTAYNGAVTQALEMWNGELTRAAIQDQGGTFLQDVIASDARPTVKVNRLFAAALGRPATPGELKFANELWQRRVQQAAQAGRGRPGSSQQHIEAAVLQDIWWALLNSNEFILNH